MFHPADWTFISYNSPEHGQLTHQHFVSRGVGGGGVLVPEK